LDLRFALLAKPMHGEVRFAPVKGELGQAKEIVGESQKRTSGVVAWLGLSAPPRFPCARKAIVGIIQT